MLKMIVEKQVLLIIAGVFMALGIGSKCVVNATLGKLVYGAGNMNKSTHPFIRLVRAKFEHACMISEKVENVGVFVDKYLYEYRVLGIRLHTLRRMERISAVLCICCGLSGAGLQYMQDGRMTDMVLKTGAIGIGAGIFVFLFHLTTDENYKLQAARNYMVDYLENICLHRYEKAYRKEKEESQKMKEKVVAASVDANVNVDKSVAANREVQAASVDMSAEKSAATSVNMQADEVTANNRRTASAGAMGNNRTVTCADRMNEKAGAADAETVANKYTENEKMVAANATVTPIRKELAKGDSPEENILREKEEKKEEKEEKKPVDKDVLIRQILEEFMA